MGKFDEAFRSRIHITLYYPELDQAAASKIWEKNPLRLKNGELDIDIEEDQICKFYEKHWADTERHPSRQWNGWQIKNTFQTAIILASWEFYEGKRDPSLKRPLLKASHFLSASETSSYFDDNISDVHGKEQGNANTSHPGREYARKDDNYQSKSRVREPSNHHKRSTSIRQRVGHRRASYTESRENTDEEDMNDDLNIRLAELELKVAKLRSLKKSLSRSRPRMDGENSVATDEDQPW